MGFDFGTSSSKIVIRTPTLARGRAVPVPFGSLGHPTSEYLLPTQFFRTNDEHVKLAPDPAGEKRHDFKIRLMQTCVDNASLRDAAVYINLAIREARTWFLRTQEREIGKRPLRWHLNVGVPSSGYDDAAMRRSFRRAAELGWMLSIDEDGTRGERIDAVGLDQDPGIEVAVVPEVAAEVVGYARSNRRRPGLHLMVDVGAATLDVCGFILHQADGDDSYNLLTALVLPLGAFALHEARVAELRGHGDVLAASVPEVGDPLEPIPDDLRDYVSLSSVPEYLSKVDECFRARCVAPIIETVMAIRARRDPRAAAFREGLPVFLCGGGARLSFYRDVVAEASRRFCQATADTRPFKVMPLEPPDVLIGDAITPDVYSRLAVAYGLSFDRYDIGDIRPPSTIDDVVARVPRGQRQEYVSKDQV